MAKPLSRLLFAHLVRVEDDRMRRVIVCQPGNRKMKEIPLLNGTAWVAIYGNEYTLAFEDAYGNRFLKNVEYTLEKLLVPCADIQECIVKEKDKKICALIYCDPAKQDAVKAFVTGVNRGLPLYKRMVPEFSAQPLPRNAMGKLLR